MLEKLTTKRSLPLISAAIALIILILTLFVFQIGVEDNGTLGSRLSEMGLYDVSQASGSGYYSQYFGVSDKSLSIKPSQFVYTLCKQFFRIDTVMNAMFPSALYVIIYIAGLYMLLKTIMTDIKWSNILACIVCLFIFCDSAYTAYFNTPYGYAVLLAFFPLLCASVINVAKSKNVLWIFLAVLCGIFVFGSLKAMAVAGILFSAYFLTLAFRIKEKLAKAVCVIGACLIFAGSFSSIIATDITSQYDSVFYGALYENQDGAPDMGLEEFESFAGVPSFETDAQELIKSGMLEDRISYGKTLLYYLKNAPHFIKNIKIAAGNGTMIRVSYLGNYTSSSGKPPQDGAGIFSLYSTIKAKILPNTLIVLIALLVLVIYFSVVYRNRYSNRIDGKVCSELSALFAVMGVIIIPVVVIISGITQITFNMFVFNLLFDLCVAFSVIGGTKLLWIKRQTLKDKYGVNQ